MMDDPNWPKDKNLPSAHPAVWAPFTLVGEGGSSARITRIIPNVRISAEALG